MHRECGPDLKIYRNGVCDGFNIPEKREMEKIKYLIMTMNENLISPDVNNKIVVSYLCAIISLEDALCFSIMFGITKFITPLLELGAKFTNKVKVITLSTKYDISRILLNHDIDFYTRSMVIPILKTPVYSNLRYALNSGFLNDTSFRRCFIKAVFETCNIHVLKVILEVYQHDPKMKLFMVDMLLKTLVYDTAKRRVLLKGILSAGIKYNEYLYAQAMDCDATDLFKYYFVRGHNIWPDVVRTAVKKKSSGILIFLAKQGYDTDIVNSTAAIDIVSKGDLPEFYKLICSTKSFQLMKNQMLIQACYKGRTDFMYLAWICDDIISGIGFDVFMNIYKSSSYVIVSGMMLSLLKAE